MSDSRDGGGERAVAGCAAGWYDTTAYASILLRDRGTVDIRARIRRRPILGSFRYCAIAGRGRCTRTTFARCRRTLEGTDGAAAESCPTNAVCSLFNIWEVVNHERNTSEVCDSSPLRR